MFHCLPNFALAVGILAGVATGQDSGTFQFQFNRTLIDDQITHPVKTPSLPWLLEGYSQIFRLYEFGLSGLKDYGSATLRCKI